MSKFKSRKLNLAYNMFQRQWSLDPLDRTSTHSTVCLAKTHPQHWVTKYSFLYPSTIFPVWGHKREQILLALKSQLCDVPEHFPAGCPPLPARPWAVHVRVLFVLDVTCWGFHGSSSWTWAIRSSWGCSELAHSACSPLCHYRAACISCLPRGCWCCL